MKTIGMIVAVEIDAVLKKYNDKLEHINARGFDCMRLEMQDHTLVIVKSGAGEIAAANACQYLISEHKAEMIVNFGVVGGLTQEMTVTKLAIVKGVVHYDFDVRDWLGYTAIGRYAQYPSPIIPVNAALYDAALKSEPSLHPVICASGDKFIADPKKKAELHDMFGADICEMEAAGIILTCDRNGVPCLFIKAVSDSIEGGADEFAREVDRCAEICLETVHKVINSMK